MAIDVHFPNGYKYIHISLTIPVNFHFRLGARAKSFSLFSVYDEVIITKLSSLIQ